MTKEIKAKKNGTVNNGDNQLFNENHITDISCGYILYKSCLPVSSPLPLMCPVHSQEI